MFSRKLATAVGLVLAVGCSSGNGSTGSSGGTSGSSGVCTLAEINTPAGCTCTKTDNSQCPTDYICDVDVTKLCIFQCNVAADCTGADAPDSTKSQCMGGLGCDCDIDPTSSLTACITKVCGTDADCGTGNVCTNGACGTAPAASTVTSCAVFPEYQLMEQGQSYTFTAQAYANGAPVHLGAATTFTWSAADASVTAGTTPGSFTGGTPTSGTANTPSVVATLNGVTCTGQVFVQAAPGATSVRAVVIDQLSGAALSGVTVIADGSAPKMTDATGAASFTGLAGPTHIVSAFLAGYGYVTVAGTTSNDLLIPLLRDATDIEGGVQGNMSNLFIATSNVHAGIVGMSIADGITNISFDLLLGPSAPTNITLGSSTYNVALPSGVLIGLSNSQFKSNYSSLGRSGYCDDPSKPNSKTLAGTCGTRSIWALGGDVPIDKLPIDQLSSGGLTSGNLNLGPILTQLLPVFRTFNSTLVRDQPITLGPLTSAGVVDQTYLTTANLNNGITTATGTANGPAVPLTLKTTIKVPQLPKLGGAYVDGAIALAGVNVAGRGLIPLGLSAGIGSTTSPADLVDSQVTSMALDQLTMNMAPSHGGAEGSPYKIGILAASFKNISGGLSASALIASPTACPAGSSQGLCYGGTIDLSAGTFPAFPEGASFDYGTRIFTAPTNATSAGQTMFRVSFGDKAGNRWVVFTNGGFTLPAAPQGFQDRTRSDDATGARSDYTLAAFYLPNMQSFDQTVAVGPNNLARADDQMVKFAIKDYSPPSITITAPTAGAAVPLTTTVTGTITDDTGHANSADDNQWVLCVSSLQTPIVTTTSCKAGMVDSSGNITSALPTATVEAAALASGYTGFLHAVIVDGTGLPLSPAVEATVAFSVQ